MGIEVTVINASHVAGWLSAAFHLGEIYMTDVRSMVGNVLSCLGQPAALPLSTIAEPSGPNLRTHDTTYRAGPLQKMSRLNIVDHGYHDDEDTSYGAIDIGSDFIDQTTFFLFRSQLVRLAAYFDRDSFVLLENCHVGRDVRLLEMFADAWNVPVIGGTGYGNSAFRSNLGRYVRVYPVVADRRRAHESFFWRGDACAPSVKSYDGASAYRETDPPKRAMGVRRLRPI